MFVFMIILSSISTFFSFVQLCGEISNTSLGNDGSVAQNAFIYLIASIISICIFSTLNAMEKKISKLEEHIENDKSNEKQENSELPENNNEITKTE